MKKKTIYHQTFYEMIPEQIEYTLYLALENVLTMNDFNHNKLLTEADKYICKSIKTDELFKHWDNLSDSFKKHIIAEAIHYGQTEGYDSGLTSTYTDNVLVEIDMFWKRGGELTVHDIKDFMEWLWNVELIDKAQHEY